MSDPTGLSHVDPNVPIARIGFILFYYKHVNIGSNEREENCTSMYQCIYTERRAVVLMYLLDTWGLGSTKTALYFSPKRRL